MRESERMQAAGDAGQSMEDLASRDQEPRFLGLRWKTLGRALLAAMILGAILRSVPLGTILATLVEASPGLVLLGLLAAAGAVAASAIRLAALVRVQRLHVSIGAIAELNFVTMFYGLMLPGTLIAGAFRWHRLARLGGKRAETLMAIVFSRLSYVTILAALALCFRMLDSGHRGGGEWPWLLLGLVLLLLVVGSALSGRAPLARLMVGSGKAPWWKTTTETLSRCAAHHRAQSLTDAARVWGAALADNLLGIVSAYLLAQSIGLEVGFATVAWVICAAEIATMLPITLAGIGVRDASLLLLLRPYGVATEQAVALSFLVLGAHVAMGVVGGVFEARRVFLARRSSPRRPSQI